MGPEAGGHDVTATVAAHVQSVLSAAEREATALQREVEMSAERRATEILLAAEAESQRMIREADDAARLHLDETRERLDAYAADRIQRIHDATERLLAAAEELAERFEEAVDARRGVASRLSALGRAAEGAAADVRGPLPPVPPPPRAPQPPGPAGEPTT